MTHRSDPAVRAIKVTKNDTLRLDDARVTGGFSGLPRAILCGTAGTANLVDAGGGTLTNFPLQQGWNPISIAIVKTGGTADDIWAIY